MEEGRRERAQSTCKSLPVSVAILSCTYNVLVALSCAYLPDDPLYIGLSIQVYAWAGSVLSILGLAGIVLRCPTLITSFAHFLFLDTLVSAACRLLLLLFFFESSHEESLCANTASEPGWSPQYFRHDIVTSVRWQKTHLWRFAHQRRCQMALGAVQIVLLTLLICCTAAQGSLAVTMRKLGREMEQQQQQPTDRPEGLERVPEKVRFDGV